MFQPDLIPRCHSSFATTSIWSLGTTEFWSSRGVPCYMSIQYDEQGKANECVEGECKYIEDIGKLLNNVCQADDMVKEIEHFVHNQQKRYANRQKPRILILGFNASCDCFLWKE